MDTDKILGLLEDVYGDKGDFYFLQLYLYLDGSGGVRCASRTHSGDLHSFDSLEELEQQLNEKLKAQGVANDREEVGRREKGATVTDFVTTRWLRKVRDELDEEVGHLRRDLEEARFWARLYRGKYRFRLRKIVNQRKEIDRLITSSWGRRKHIESLREDNAILVEKGSRLMAVCRELVEPLEAGVSWDISGSGAAWNCDYCGAYTDEPSNIEHHEDCPIEVARAALPRMMTSGDRDG